MGSAASVDHTSAKNRRSQEKADTVVAPHAADGEDGQKQATASPAAAGDAQAVNEDPIASRAGTQRQDSLARDDGATSKFKQTDIDSHASHAEASPASSASASGRASPAPAVEEFLTDIRQFYENKPADADADADGSGLVVVTPTFLGGARASDAPAATGENPASDRGSQPLRRDSSFLSLNARGSYALPVNVAEEVTGRTTPNSSAASSAVQSRSNSMTTVSDALLGGGGGLSGRSGGSGGVSAVAVEKAVREAAEQERSQLLLLLREPTREEVNMDHDPTNAHGLLRCVWLS